MNRHKEIQNELRELNSSLHGVPKENKQFNAPPDYFNSLQERVFSEIGKEAEAGKVDIERNKPKQRLYTLFSAAAMILLIAGAIIFYERVESDKGISMEDLSTSAISNYIFNNIDDFDSDMFLALAEETELNENIYDQELLENYILENINTQLLEEEYLKKN